MAARRATALAAALFVFGLGEELWFRYLPEYLRAFGASAFAVGLFGTWKDLLDAVYAYPGGVVTDRIGTRRSLILFGSLTVAGITLLLVHASPGVVFAAMTLVMAWSSLGLPATFSLIGEELEGHRRVVGFTVQAIVKRVPIVIAPPLGGLLLERHGIRVGMRIGFAISIVLSAAMLVILARALSSGPSDSAPAAPKATAGGDRSRPRLRPELRQLLVADCLVRLCEGLPDVFLVVWAIEVVHLTPVRFGVLTSILMLTAIASYVPAAALARRAEKKPFVILTYVFFTLFPLAVLASRSFAALAAAFAVGGLREIGEPARKALIVDLADPAARGRTVGTYYTLRGLAVAGAAAIGGVLWTIRPSLTFLVAAGLGAAGTAWAAAFLPKHPPGMEGPT
ncbi:MAG TPA: MFS transporter [Thermoanaerobaculia bacterium]|nr:MFS transporter [Thermoanaerobaculia bacterium]